MHGMHAGGMRGLGKAQHTPALSNHTHVHEWSLPCQLNSRSSKRSEVCLTPMHVKNVIRELHNRRKQGVQETARKRPPLHGGGMTTTMELSNGGGMTMTMEFK